MGSCYDAMMKQRAAEGRDCCGEARPTHDTVQRLVHAEVRQIRVHLVAVPAQAPRVTWQQRNRKATKKKGNTELNRTFRPSKFIRYPKDSMQYTARQSGSSSWDWDWEGAQDVGYMTCARQQHGLQRHHVLHTATQVGRVSLHHRVTEARDSGQRWR